MHGFVKKGLLVSLASGALVLGGAGFAAADTASATGSTTGNQGLGAGDVVQAAGDNPINVCGDAVNPGAANNGVKGNSCTTSSNAAAATGTSNDSSGLVAGDVV